MFIARHKTSGQLKLAFSQEWKGSDQKHDRAQ